MESGTEVTPYYDPMLAKLIARGDTEPMNDAHEIRARFEHQIEAVIDAGACRVGTYAGYLQPANQEVALMVSKGGMTPRDALIAATKGGPDLMGL